jgi:hypothetical protein
MNVTMIAVADLLCEQNYYHDSVNCMLKYLCNNVLKAEVLAVSDISYHNQYKNVRRHFDIAHVSFPPTTEKEGVIFKNTVI